MMIVGIDHRSAACEVGVDGDPPGRRGKPPRLSIVTVRGERGKADQVAIGGMHGKKRAHRLLGPIMIR